jgi:PPP family 3-phenylpropionic acid transporter
LMANPFWGAISDRWQIHTLVLAGCSLATGLVALLFIPVSAFMVLLMLVILLYFFRAPIPAIADNAVMSIVSRTGISYGRQRAWGSVGFVVTSLGLGAVLSVSDMDVIFWLYGLTMAVLLVGLSFFLPIERYTGRVNLIGGIRTLAARPAYRGFLMATALAGIGSGCYFNFLGLHILELGGSESQVGMAYAANALAEIPIMFLGARWFQRYNNTTLITIGFLFFALGFAVVGAMLSPLPLILAASLIGIAYGIFWVAAVGYANDTAPEGMGATAQAAVSAAQMGLGWGLGAIIGGILWDTAGGSAVFWAGSIAASLAVVVFRIGLRAGNR